MSCSRSIWVKILVIGINIVFASILIQLLAFPKNWIFSKSSKSFSFIYFCCLNFLSFFLSLYPSIDSFVVFFQFVPSYKQKCTITGHLLLSCLRTLILYCLSYVIISSVHPSLYHSQRMIYKRNSV